MEQQPHQGGEPSYDEHELSTPPAQAIGSEHEHEVAAADVDGADQPMTATQLRREALDHTHQAVTEALRDGRPIDHETARVIAAVLYDRRDSALGILAATGAATGDLAGELEQFRTTAPIELEPWLDALDEYVSANAAEHQVDDTDEQNPDSSDIPSSHGGQASAERASPIDDRTARDLASKFQRAADGPLAILTACGAILNEDDELYRELFAGWEQQTPEEQVQAEALRAYVASRDDQGPVSYWGDDRHETASGVQPEIWVGSLSDHNNGVIHGLWIAADQGVDELQEQVAWMLRASPTARRYGDVAEEYGIFDYSGFAGYEVSEWSSLTTVSLIAHGIAEYGPAYAAWVEYVGDTAGELADDEAFRDHYLGEWDSLEEYVEYVLEETGFTQQLDTMLQQLPEDLRRYVKVEVDGIAEEWTQGLHVVDAPGGRVWVFDARA